MAEHPDPECVACQEAEETLSYAVACIPDGCGIAVVPELTEAFHILTSLNVPELGLWAVDGTVQTRFMTNARLRIDVGAAKRVSPPICF